MSDLLRDRIIDYLRTRDPQLTAAALEGIGDDTNLVKERIIDSVGLVDLLLFLEGETGQQIDFMAVDPERMMTLAGIRALFGVGNRAGEAAVG